MSSTRPTLLAAALLFPIAATPAWSAPDRSCFARALPADIRDHRLDDVKLLIGYVFDAAAAHQALAQGAIIDRQSGLAKVPGFAGATSLAALAGRYRVMHAPFDLGHGYYGLEVGALEADGRISSLYLINRLFRLPIILQQPGGVVTDIVTNGAMFAGWQTRAIRDANAAAAIAFNDATHQTLALILAGQSQAGGVAQLQAATLATAHGHALAGFITLNAASVTASVRHAGMIPDAVDGINFVKDLDPGFGPHGLLPNQTGLQIYIHPDGTGSGTPGTQSFFAAWRHPDQHLLSSFNDVSLTRALAHVLENSGPPICPRESPAAPR